MVIILMFFHVYQRVFGSEAFWTSVEFVCPCGSWILSAKQWRSTAAAGHIWAWPVFITQQSLCVYIYVYTCVYCIDYCISILVILYNYSYSYIILQYMYGLWKQGVISKNSSSSRLQAA